MNLLDVAVLAVFGVCVYTCYKKGLLLSLYSLCSAVISMVVAWRVYPMVSNFLMNISALYNLVYSKVESGLGLDAAVAEQSLKLQNELIGSLNLPGFVTESLQAGNNPVLYELFKATNITEYIYAHLTALCINGIALILTFLITHFIMRLVLKSLNVVTKLPVIHGLNSIGGILVGIVSGFLTVWIAGVVVVMLISMGIAPGLGSMIDGSILAHLFLTNNILLKLL